MNKIKNNNYYNFLKNVIIYDAMILFLLIKIALIYNDL